MEIYNTFEFGVEENGKIGVLKAKFEEYVNPKKNTVFERYKFWEYKRKEGETVDQLVTELKTRAKTCVFGDQHDSMIRDRIVFGVSDTRLKERLLRESSELSLEKAASLCRAAEASKSQLKELQTSERSKPVHAVKPKAKQKPLNTPQKQPQSNCRNCGTKHLPRLCPAFGQLCLKCKQKNHYARMCPQKNTRVHLVTPSEQVAFSGQVDSEEALFIGTLSDAKNVEESAWFSNLLVDGTLGKFKLDTGAEANVLPLSVYSKLKSWKLALFFHRMETSR